MINWLRRLIGDARDAITDLRDRVINAFVQTWLLLQQLFSTVKQAWGQFGARLAFLRDNLFLIAASTLNTLRGIILVRIPAAIRTTLSQAMNFASHVVSTVRTELAGAINLLSSWARSAVKAISDFINGIVRWASNLFHSILSALTTIGGIVNQLLTNPAALVRWFIGALWHEAFIFLYARRVTIAQWALARAVSVTSFTVSVIEDLIVRIL